MCYWYLLTRLELIYCTFTSDFAIFILTGGEYSTLNVGPEIDYTMKKTGQ